MDERGTTAGYEGMDREELRALVWAHTDEDVHRLAYDVRYVRMFGATAGLMLSQLVFWSDKGHDPNGWLYFTKEDLRDVFGIGTRHEVDTARRHLKRVGVLEEDKKPRARPDGGYYGPSPVLHYRVDLAALVDLLDRFEEDPEGTIRTLNRGSKRPESDGSDVNGVYMDVNGVYNEQPESGALNGRNPATQGAGMRRFKQPESGALNSGIPALPITESTYREDNREPSEINNRELSEGSINDPLNKIKEEPHKEEDKDGSEGRALAGVVEQIEAAGIGGALLEHARRAGAIGPAKDGLGETDVMEGVAPLDRGTRRRYVAVGDGELVPVGGRAREGRKYV